MQIKLTQGFCVVFLQPAWINLKRERGGIPIGRNVQLKATNVTKQKKENKQIFCIKELGELIICAKMARCYQLNTNNAT